MILVNFAALRYEIINLLNITNDRTTVKVE